ncbi:hypothetical protein TREMEDRAFT_65558 [Tremella mesenterica DSM 1558]|uniref:uncharacterized protein n=1 Tax=Tremella mesenterica (strain ATCC 24925 / CBS 8224 / DSM 1558 / NBRC 9311 / NRRL Y-6157 / RJB 2259-6 / UBC 559-6) TaxID=578456 RepID=UPI00032CDF9B|nr:uncharacterized protein TREMEDRAFT_65558 [Tremella mesenterica DSM 1558]EIW66287.1 hypothetical protein TREMEDRAFT_65558 [Tremella mesenterica DSM 1558]
MGKRKSTMKVQTKRAEPLATTFKCLFCNHEKAVVVKLHKDVMQAELSCKYCHVNWQTTMSNLTAAVDVYSEFVSLLGLLFHSCVILYNRNLIVQWIDKCEEERIKHQIKKKRAAKKDQEASQTLSGDNETRREREDIVEEEEEEHYDGGYEDRTEKRRRVDDYDDEEEE